MKPVVVMKFGGTSVATPTGRAALIDRVRAVANSPAAPVVVVSALGRRPAPYATDSLLDLVADLPCDARETDLLSHVGELISAVLVAAELRAAGVSARAYSGAEAGIITDDTAGNARILRICPDALCDALANDIVPVVAGFQGISESGHTTTLGRGGSDTSACALGVALDAERVEIYTDVDGVMSSDPRVVTSARVLDTITSDELFQLARSGSRVVHKSAAELTLASGAALLVKNTFSTHAGTRVCDLEPYRTVAPATAIAHLEGITRFCVRLDAPEGEPAHSAAQAAVYRRLAADEISLDMFTPAGCCLYFTVPADQALKVDGALDDLGLSRTVTPDLAKVTVIGEGMHGRPGVMATVADALATQGIDIIQTADSHMTISVLVASRNAGAAVNALHSAFNLE
ncbi:MAG: aspartate kinase [Actinomycetes bacterium]|nr:aspartate kinase [Actinomycetes bacterium]